MQGAPEEQHGGDTVNKGLGMERIPKLLDLATASVLVAGPQECRAQFEWMAARNAGPEPLGRTQGESQVSCQPFHRGD